MTTFVTPLRAVVISMLGDLAWVGHVEGVVWYGTIINALSARGKKDHAT